jgi:hypothetical protein
VKRNQELKDLMYVMRKNGSTLLKACVFGCIIMFCFSFIGILSF